MKMKELIIGATTIAVLITGCYSFNRIEITEQTRSTVNAEEIALRSRHEAEQLIKKISLPGKKICPPYAPPTLPKMPDLPYDELAKANPNDPTALDTIQTKHIEDLRQHILKIKILIEESQKDHAARCQNTMVINTVTN